MTARNAASEKKTARKSAPSAAKRGKGATLVRRRPIAVDLFAGVGGLSLGFEQAGFDVVASVEYDPVHAAAHAYNFPLTEVLCADVSRISSEDLRAAVRRGLASHDHDAEAWDGEIDVIFGGPPCQGFSTMGKRLIDDQRNSLVFHFFRLISELRPRYFVMENVPGMAAGGHAGILARLVEEFEQSGYQVVQPHRILNASAYGVPQDRRRLILLGAREGEPLPKYPEPNVRPVPKRSGESKAKMLAVHEDLPVGPTVWDALGDLPDLDQFAELLDTDEVQLSPSTVRSIERASSPYARKLQGLDQDPEDLSHPRKWEKSLLTGSMRTIHTQLSIQRFAATVPGETEPVSRFYRLDSGGLSNTLRSGTGSERGAYTSPRPIHPVLPRVISVREAARLHSYPDWFRFHRTKWHGFRQIGNSVPPLLGRAIGKEIAAALGVAPPKPTERLWLEDVGLLDLRMKEATAYYGASPEEVPQPRKRIGKESENVDVAKVEAIQGRA